MDHGTRPVLLSVALWPVVSSDHLLWWGYVTDYPVFTVCTPTKPHFVFLYLKYRGLRFTHLLEALRVSRPEGGDFVESDNVRVCA